MTINLDLFCSSAGIPFSMARPFTQGEFTFATNGHIAVRVPRIPRIHNRRGTPDAATLFDLAFKPRARFRALPSLTVEPEPCSLCWDGVDETGVCVWCHGSSRLFPTILLGNQMFDGRYIALIRDHLPNARLALAGKRKERPEPASFRFTGGEGLLMPMREPSPGMPVIKSLN